MMISLQIDIKINMHLKTYSRFWNHVIEMSFYEWQQLMASTMENAGSQSLLAHFLFS